MEDTPVTFPVLNNDGDIDGDALSISGFTQPAHGTVVKNADGSFTYTPATDYNGDDSFSYTVCDPSGLCDTATVSIVVGAVNDPPVAKNDSLTLNEDSTATINAVLNDTDVDGNLAPNTAIVVSNPSHGTVVNNGDGTFSYTPIANYNGTDSFTYQVCDAFGECSTATVSINVLPVNDAPDASNDGVKFTLAHNLDFV